MTTDTDTDGPALWDLLERRVAATPTALFASDERGQVMTFAQLRDASVRVAAALADEGVCSDTVVSWQLPTWIEGATLTLALNRLGATQNPLVPILRRREVAFICRQACTDLLIVPGTWRGFDYPGMAESVAAGSGETRVLVVDRVLPEADGESLPNRPQEPARWYFYTSGTTADPKGAIHTDRTLLAAARGFSGALGVTARDRMTMVIPLTHVGGIIHLMASLESGCAMVFAEGFHPELTPMQLREGGATILPGGLPFIQAFFAFQADHRELEPLFPAGRMFIHGGSPKPPTLHAEVRERLGTVGVISGYGMTECPMAVWNTPGVADELIATTEGRPVPGVEIAVVEEDGRPAATGDEGEVRVRGPQLMIGYVDASLAADAVDENGFFRSGDLGRLDDSGSLTITGRLKDVIIRNMENISATEVENLLYSHPKVGDVAVIGVPDPRTGERACAVVVPADAGDAPGLAELCEWLLAAGLSNRKLPEQLELVEVLPRNGMHKVLKSELRDRFHGLGRSAGD